MGTRRKGQQNKPSVEEEMFGENARSYRLVTEWLSFGPSVRTFESFCVSLLLDGSIFCVDAIFSLRNYENLIAE